VKKVEGGVEVCDRNRTRGSLNQEVKVWDATQGGTPGG